MTASAHPTEGALPRPRISVVLPHLNEPDNLRQCLEAIRAAAAGGPSLEVIVADNGSKVPPVAICDAYPFARLVVEPQPGPGPARNAAAGMAKGELICFIDSDCFVEPDYFKVCIAFFDNHPKCDFVGGAIGIWPSHPPELLPTEAYEAVFSYRTEMFVRRQGFAATGNMVVRTRVFRVVGPFAGIGRHEDREWGHRAVSMGFHIDYLPGARVLTAGSLTYSALAIRTERHVAHDFAETGEDWRSRLRWCAVAGMVLVSPILGLGEIRRCPQVTSIGLGLQVFAYLCRIRAYRAWLMLDALRRGSSEQHLARWNRS